MQHSTSPPAGKFKMDEQLHDFEVNSIDLIYKHALKMVKKCIDGKLCENFENYFEKSDW